MRLHDGPVWEYVKYAATATLSDPLSVGRRRAERRTGRLAQC